MLGTAFKLVISRDYSTPLLPRTSLIRHEACQAENTVTNLPFEAVQLIHLVTKFQILLPIGHAELNYNEKLNETKLNHT